MLFSSYFIIRVFGRVEFNAVIFHLQFPLLDNDNSGGFVKSYILRVIAPSVFCAFCITFPHIIHKCVAWLYAWFLRASLPKFGLAFVLLALCVNVANNKLKISHYLKTQKTYSNLYEAHYKPFEAPLTHTPTQNLIVIFVESLESTFSAKATPLKVANRGGGITSLLLANTRLLVSLSLIFRNLP